MIRRNQGRTDLLLYQAETRGQPLGTVRIGREELGPYSPCIVRVGVGHLCLAGGRCNKRVFRSACTRGSFSHVDSLRHYGL